MNTLINVELSLLERMVENITTAVEIKPSQLPYVVEYLVKQYPTEKPVDLIITSSMDGLYLELAVGGVTDHHYNIFIDNASGVSRIILTMNHNLKTIPGLEALFGPCVPELDRVCYHDGYAGITLFYPADFDHSHIENPGYETLTLPGHNHAVSQYAYVNTNTGLLLDPDTIQQQIVDLIDRTVIK